MHWWLPALIAEIHWLAWSRAPWINGKTPSIPIGLEIPPFSRNEVKHSFLKSRHLEQTAGVHLLSKMDHWTFALAPCRTQSPTGRRLRGQLPSRTAPSEGRDRQANQGKRGREQGIRDLPGTGWSLTTRALVWAHHGKEKMQCSFLGLSFLSIIYSQVDIDMDAHNNHTGDIKSKRIHQTLSPKKFGAAYGCRRTGATSEAKEIYRGSISVCKSWLCLWGTVLNIFPFSCIFFPGFVFVCLFLMLKKTNIQTLCNLKCQLGKDWNYIVSEPLRVTQNSPLSFTEMHLGLGSDQWKYISGDNLPCLAHNPISTQSIHQNETHSQ